MVLFNNLILQNWKSIGYKHVHFVPLKKFGVVQPLMEEKPIRKGYTISISELQLVEMSNAVDSFYFLAKDKHVRKLQSVI